MATTPTEASEPCDGVGFVCVCVQKGVEFDIVDHKLHRANKDKELHEELEKLSSSGPSQYAYQLGGGCRVVMGGAAPRTIHLASWGDSIAAFEGTLENGADLAKAFPSTHTVTTATVCAAAAAEAAAAAAAEVTQAPGEDMPLPNPAELVCLMYGTIGMELLGLLRGKFSFCLYHAKTGRVLAARDTSGAVPMYQGLSPSESLVISSNKAFVSTCHDVKEFQPGHFKYGWYAEPRKFSLRSLNHHHHGHTPCAHAHKEAGPHSHREGGARHGSGAGRRSLDAGARQPARQGSLDGSGSGKGHMDSPRQQQQQQQRGGRRSSTDCGNSVAAAARQQQGKGKQGGLASPAASNGSEEGSWRSQRLAPMDEHRASPGAAAMHKGPRRSSDVGNHGHGKANRQKGGDQGATGTGADRSAPGTPAAAAAGSKLPAGPVPSPFKWDVNAPVFCPKQECARAVGAAAAGVPQLVD